MIDLTGGFHIDADERCFVVVQDKVTKKGEQTLKVRGYYPNLEQAIVATLKFGARKIVAEERKTLKEFVTELRKMNADLEQAIKGAKV